MRRELARLANKDHDMPDRDERGWFLPGNRAWEGANFEKFHRKPKFAGPEPLIEAVLSYFEWVHENPLIEDNIGWFQGVATHEPAPKMRAMNLAGLCNHIGISRRTWSAWKNEKNEEMYRPDLVDVIDWAEDKMFDQKFTGAAAGLFSVAIIARDLGLADKQEIAGDPDKPLTVQSITRRIVDPKDGN